MVWDILINIINFQKHGHTCIKKKCRPRKTFFKLYFFCIIQKHVLGEKKVVGIYILNVITYIVLETTYTLVPLLSIYLYLSYIPDYQISSL